MESATLTQLVARAGASQAGSHRQKSSSVSAFLSTLIPAAVVAIVLVLGFMLLRRKQQRVYAPRTYVDVLGRNEKTPRVTAPGLFAWLPEYRKLPDEYVLNHQSLDSYLYLRFFKMIIVISLVGCCITWPILFPVNATGGGGQSGFDVLSFSNVNSPNRYYAHVFVAWIYLGFIMFTITRETIYFINLRQAYLLAPRNASKISARTVLFTFVPSDFLSEVRIRQVFHDVAQVWIPSETDDLEDLVEERDDAVVQLETAEIKLCQTANKKRLKKKQPATQSAGHDPERSGTAAMEWLNAKDRPTHKLKPIIGKKVDTIDWSRDRLRELVPKVAKMQESYKNGAQSPVGAVFVEFRTQRAAQAAFQQIAHEVPMHFTPRAIGVPPSQIIWKNLGMKYWDYTIRMLLASGIISAIILFWSLPVAFIGVLTNINYLTNRIPFLSFINDIPSVILGVITGLLPTILLAALMALVPIFCRLLSKFAGAVTLPEVELKTQSWYFGFQVIQVFLVTTFTSGAASVATQILDDPTSAPQLLAKNLPKASNFYISYFVLYGVALGASTLFSLVPLLMFNVLGRILDKTPRKKFNRYTVLADLGWGSVYPKFTNLAVIAISYSCIAPLVLGFATVGLGLLYLAFRYNFLYVLTNNVDTKGASYGRALQQLMVGVYLAEFCLIGLFAINIGTSPTSSGPLILMIIFLIGTIVYQNVVRKALHPLTVTLPANLLAETERDWNAERILEDGSSERVNIGKEQSDGKAHPHSPELAALRTPEEKSGSLIQRFLNPAKYASFHALRETMRTNGHDEPVPPYTAEEAREAYCHPVVKAETAETPLLWIVRDPMGISKQEVRHSSEVVNITDEGAWLDEKNNVMWDQESVRQAPLWEGRVEY
ncbi:DUF221-domain-containing protein [Saccharata proteae CBS 121410]|uniref:DUF221-domain-containing protein n=1 Tax=Saccharata proteae CBS 121410 TaxID=1314787 RepID=A0A9P4HS99_9PEZI|nr:DUF221-domain-containing protein [Saccharata proteae CBS 121410]